MNRLTYFVALVLLSFVVTTSFAQNISINQDLNGSVYLFDADRKSYTYIDSVNLGAMYRVKVLDHTRVRIFFRNGKDSLSKDYIIGKSLVEGGKFLLISSIGSRLTYRYSESEFYVDAKMNFGNLWIYKGKELLCAYNPFYRGWLSAFIQCVPTALDTQSQTILIEERISPDSYLFGNYQKHVREISYRKDNFCQTVWESQLSSNASYSFDKKYIMYYSKKRKKEVVSYYNKLTNTEFEDRSSVVAFWL